MRHVWPVVSPTPSRWIKGQLGLWRPEWLIPEAERHAPEALLCLPFHMGVCHTKTGPVTRRYRACTSEVSEGLSNFLY